MVNADGDAMEKNTTKGPDEGERMSETALGGNRDGDGDGRDGGDGGDGDGDGRREKGDERRRKREEEEEGDIRKEKRN